MFWTPAVWRWSAQTMGSVGSYRALDPVGGARREEEAPGSGSTGWLEDTQRKCAASATRRAEASAAARSRSQARAAMRSRSWAAEASDLAARRAAAESGASAGDIPSPV